MSLCRCDQDVRGIAVQIMERCKQIEEQQGVGLAVMQHVTAIKADAYALWQGSGKGYETKGTTHA